MTKRFLIFSFSLFLTASVVQGYEWYFAFDAGHCLPLNSFDALVNDDVVYGLSVDYIPNFIPGVRVAYNHQNFPVNTEKLGSSVKIDSLGVWAVMDYSFPDYFRFFGLVGPSYFASQGTQKMSDWSRSSVIGWSAGAGFDFEPFPGWGFRFQSVYNSANFGRGPSRASWVNSTIGMSFRF